MTFPDFLKKIDDEIEKGSKIQVMVRNISFSILDNKPCQSY